ncbi:MAG: hypothetical protein JSU63_13455 [Phycisphaerales bacterium]|nr:MAG: hypothetical protein JSU63_13455 [Phycisphaerales bacterium]
MKNYATSLSIIVLSLSLTGCAIFTPVETVLAGSWTITPSDPGDFADWDYEATFNASGRLTELSAAGPDEASVALDVENATSEVNGSDVTITIPTAAGTRVFEGTLSADQNTLTGTMSLEIDLEDLEVSLPGGELTLERVTS